MPLIWMVFELDTEQKDLLVAEANLQNLEYETKNIEYFKLENDTLFYNGEPVSVLPKIVLLRCRSNIEKELHHYFKKHGVRAINNYFCLKHCNDKLSTYKLLEKERILQPKTLTFRQGLSYAKVVEKLGSEFVVKDKLGQGGKQVSLIRNETDFQNIIAKIRKEDILIQEYIKESFGKDLRAYVVGETVIGGILRTNPADFRSNISQGGTSVRYDLSQQQKECALKAAKALKGEVVSIDFLLKGDCLYFCEANSNACIEPLASAGYPIAKSVIDYLVQQI